jgi:hypothetical protein
LAVQRRNGVDTSDLLPDFVVHRAEENLRYVGDAVAVRRFDGDAASSVPYGANLSTVASELASDVYDEPGQEKPPFTKASP